MSEGPDSGAGSAPAPERAASFLAGFVPPRSIGRWAVALLLLTIALAWISIGVELSNLLQLNRARAGTGVPADLRIAQRATELVLLWLQGALLVATATAFIAWLYTTRANLRAFGVRRPRFARGWCIWGFLIPALNFFRPYQVVSEIWQASDPANLDPFRWREQPVPRIVSLWWASFTAWMGLRTLALLTGFGTGASLERIHLSLGLALMADLASALSAALACFVVLRLSDAQDAKWALDPARHAGGSPTA